MNGDNSSHVTLRRRHKAVAATDLMASLFDEGNPGDEGAALSISDFSPDEIVNQALIQFCAKLGLKSSSHDEIQKAITVVSYAAISEIVAHSFGIAGFAKLDLTGK